MCILNPFSHNTSPHTATIPAHLAKRIYHCFFPRSLLSADLVHALTSSSYSSSHSAMWSTGATTYTYCHILASHTAQLNLGPFSHPQTPVSYRADFIQLVKAVSQLERAGSETSAEPQSLSPQISCTVQRALLSSLCDHPS